jgi:hypothetical protein
LWSGWKQILKPFVEFHGLNFLNTYLQKFKNREVEKGPEIMEL